MKRNTDRRAFIVLGATVAAIVGVDLAIGPDHPTLALLATVAILVGSSAVLPSPMWLWFTAFCRRVPPALDRQGVKPPRTLVITALACGLYLAVDVPVFGRSIPAGCAILGVIAAGAVLAIWRPGRDTIRQWRDERLEERRLSRQLTQLDACDTEDFSGKGIPRKDWARFNEALAGVLREMRASEEPGK